LKAEQKCRVKRAVYYYITLNSQDNSLKNLEYKGDLRNKINF